MQAANRTQNGFTDLPPTQSEMEMVKAEEKEPQHDSKHVEEARGLYAIPSQEAEDSAIMEVQFPGSTYTLLFTSPKASIPFVFAILSTSLCYVCLLLALFNLFSESTRDNLFNAPAGVNPEVRGAQYVGALVGILMEEEIPEAIQLARTFSRESLKNHTPRLSYKRFIFSAACRVIIGYLYIMCVFLVIAQSDNVLDIFYDLLALQFAQSIDDVAFALAQREMFGERLFTATSRDYVIQKSTDSKSCFKKSRLIKFFYLINLGIIYSALAYVTVQQKNGAYVCQVISVKFGDDIWEDALILGEDQTRFLEYAYFNGIYKVSGSLNGRPRYVEQNKRDGGEFPLTVGAEIIFCPELEKWVFTHKDIVKNLSTKIQDESHCNWLMKSGSTVEYDLSKMDTEWYVWTGTIEMGRNVEIICDECHSNSDCNYHGVCSDQRCMCDKSQGYHGQRCEHAPPSCTSLQDDYFNEYSLAVLDGNVFITAYGHNVYFQTFRTANMNSTDIYAINNEQVENDLVSDGDDFFTNDMNGFSLALVHSGNRWFGVAERSSSNEFLKFGANFHAFWLNYFSESSVMVSEITFGSSPVGVDFNQIIEGDKNKEYGPYGRLKPLAQYEGDGFFHCMASNTSTTNSSEF